MTLYLVTYSYDYEGGDVIGVYDNKEGAEKALAEHTPSNADSKDIIEFEVNEYLGVPI